MLSIIATTCIALGVGLLYATWRSVFPGMGRVLGWGSILLGAFVWSTQTGADRGIALALIFLCVVGLCFVGTSAMAALFARPSSTPAIASQRKRSLEKPLVHSGKPNGFWVFSLNIRRRIALFFLTGPAAALLALTAALASHQALLRWGVDAANALVTELFLFPVLWGCLAVWCLMACHLWRRSAQMAAFQCLAAAVLFVLAS